MYIMSKDTAEERCTEGMHHNMEIAMLGVLTKA
jgi:hypothetical protein